MTPEEGHTEALRRIAEAQQTGATELILFHLNITKIPPELLNCHSLTSLDLSDNQIIKFDYLPKSIRTLNLSYNRISLLGNIPEGLHVLNLSYTDH